MNKLRQVQLLLIAFVFSPSADAAGLDSGNMLNNILESFSAVAITWKTEVTASATWLFWGLALISMIWTYGFLALRNADLQAFFSETIRFFGTLGFFWWLLTNGPSISLSIIDTMRAVSAKASGLGSGLSPSSIVDIGFNILTKVSASASLLSPVVSALMLIASIIVLVILALIAVNMLLLLVSAWLLAYAGIFLLGFGGSRWTSEIAINFYKSVLGIGVQLFTMTFLIGVGKSFLDQYYNAFQASTPDLNSLCVLLVASVILLSLVNKLPPMFAGIVSSTGHASGIGSFGAGAAISAATMAASAAASAGSTALASVNQLGGGASALTAAFKAAQADIDSTTFSDAGGLAGGLGNDQSAASNMGQSSFAQAMGTNNNLQDHAHSSRIKDVMKITAEAGSILAKNVGQTISAQASIGISNSAGGRLATTISENSEPSHSERTMKFEGDSIGGYEDEISNFVNKKP